MKHPLPPDAIATTLPFPELDGNIHEPARLRILALLLVIEEALAAYREAMEVYLECLRAG